MSRGVAAGFAITAAAISVTIAVIRSRDIPHYDVVGFEPAVRVCVTSAPVDAGASAADSAANALGHRNSMAALVLALDDRALSSLEEALQSSAARWETQRNPLLEDLEGVPPDESMTQWFITAPPAAGIARASTRSHACAADGFCASIVGRSAKCQPGTAPAPDDAGDDRARFLLWPWGYAIVLTMRSADQAIGVAACLRARINASRTLGLIVTSQDVAALDAPRYANVRALWTRRAMLADEANDSPASVATIVTQPNEVFVLPRLSAITDLGSFHREANGCLR